MLTKQRAPWSYLSGQLPLGMRIGGHILFWVSIVLYEGLILSVFDNSSNFRISVSLIELPVKILATYFTLFILIDQYLIKKKYLYFVILLLLSMASFGLLARVVAYFVVYPLYYPAASSLPLLFLPKILVYTFTLYSLVAMASTFHLIRHGYRHQQATLQWQRTSEQLEKEKLAAELKLLKSQINPHFLFNTLNNLYTLSLSQSEKTPEVVFKLSQLMSYMLYDSNQPEVTMEKEVQYLRNYIELEKIRYSSLDVSMNVFDDLRNVSIAPLLLLPFVENSFKHGVSNQLTNPWIRIDILLQGKLLVLKVENSKEPETSTHKSVSGIGLVNVRKRLDLIYPDSYSLQIINEVDLYLVILKIDLSGNGELLKASQELKIEEDEVSYR